MQPLYGITAGVLEKKRKYGVCNTRHPRSHHTKAEPRSHAKVLQVAFAYRSGMLLKILKHLVAISI